MDEHRYGLISTIAKIWAPRGIRLAGAQSAMHFALAPHQTKYEWGYQHTALDVLGEKPAEILYTPSVNKGNSE